MKADTRAAPIWFDVPEAERVTLNIRTGVLGDVVTALRVGVGLLGALRRGVTYLLVHARRAHPERDRRAGRLRAGLTLVEPA